MKELSFNLKLGSVLVHLNGGTPEEALHLELREMDASTRDSYLDGLSARMRMDADGKVTGLKRFEGMQAGLLTLCLYKFDGTRVSDKEIQKWPSSTVTELFNAAQELNHLSPQEAPVKNV